MKFYFSYKMNNPFQDVVNSGDLRRKCNSLIRWFHRCYEDLMAKKKKGSLSCLFFIRDGELSLVTQFLDRGQLSNSNSQFSLSNRIVNARLAISHGILRHIFDLISLRFVEILAANSGVSHNGNRLGLDFENAAGDENKFFVILTRHANAHGARLDAGDQRGMLGIDTQLACLARKRDELGRARVDLLFGRDHVNLNCVCHKKPLIGKSISVRCV